MDKKVVVGILLVAAIALGYFFAWPKLKPYFSAPPADSAPVVAPTGAPGDANKPL